MSTTPPIDQVNVAISEFIHALGLDPKAVSSITVSAAEDAILGRRAVVVEQMVFDEIGAKVLGEFVTTRLPWTRVAVTAA